MRETSDNLSGQGVGGSVLDTATVELKIPCQAEFIGVARLVILGVASRTSFSYDEVEDLRLAVGEACTSAIERAENAGKPDSFISIRCTTEPDRMTINVADSLPLENGDASKSSVSLDFPEEKSIGALLIEILVDEIHSESNSESGTSITMVKYLGRS
jgi:serine/threonine-protein kinase RsbW